MVYQGKNEELKKGKLILFNDEEVHMKMISNRYNTFSPSDMKKRKLQ
jgi:ASC-1-like (ASCH) protein